MSHRSSSASLVPAGLRLALGLTPLLLVSPVHALPEGGNVVAGDITLVQTGPQRLDIVQQTARGAIDWQSFGIGAGEHVNFQQPSAQAVTLNRVVGGDVSGIFGRLTANGRVFLVNPNGVLFGRTAQVDVGGLVASTANLSNENFLAGRDTFDRAGSRAGTIVNQGGITAAEGGLVAFVAPGVENAGVITARLGRVALVSGDTFTLDLYGDQLVGLAVSDATLGGIAGVRREELPAFVRQSGQIAADGGNVLLTAGAAREVVDGVVNLSGSIRARSVENRNGEIVLLGGRVEVAEGATLDVSATGAEGNGGNIFVSSASDTRFSGRAMANAGTLGGDGGFIEISGSDRFTFRGDASASAPGGRSGTVFFDPPDLRIGVGQDVEPDTISSMLQGGTSVIQAATNDIFVNDRIDGRGGVAGAKLTLNAGRNVELNHDILTNGGDVEINATAGKITMAGTGPVTTMSGGQGTAILTGGDKVTFNAAGDILLQHLVNTGGVAAVSTSATGEVTLNQKLVANGPVVVSGKKVTLSHSIFTTGQNIELGRADGSVILNPAGDEQLTGVVSDALTLLLGNPTEAKLIKVSGKITSTGGQETPSGVTVELTTNQITLDSGGGDILVRGALDIDPLLRGDPNEPSTLSAPGEKHQTPFPFKAPKPYVALSLAAGTGEIVFSKGIAAHRTDDLPARPPNSVSVKDFTPTQDNLYSTNTLDLQIRSARKVTAGEALYVNSITPTVTVNGAGVDRIFHFVVNVETISLDSSDPDGPGILPPTFAEAVLPGAATSASGGIPLTVPLAPALPPTIPPPSIPTTPPPSIPEPTPSIPTTPPPSTPETPTAPPPTTPTTPLTPTTPETPTTPTTPAVGANNVGEIIGSVDATGKETASHSTEDTPDVVIISGGRGVGQSADLGRHSAANGPAPDVFSGGNQVVEADLGTDSGFSDNAYLRRDAFGRDLKEEEKKRKQSK